MYRKLTKQYKRVFAQTEYAHLSEDTILMVCKSMEQNLIFGLYHDEEGIEDNAAGTWICDPNTWSVFHYYSISLDHYVIYTTWDDFELQVLRLLYTHESFADSSTIHKFLLACKALKETYGEHFDADPSPALPDDGIQN